jgi:alkylhydroperoxidase/carboxymuconolactone decarboxylase family protein YurZ
MDFLAVIREAGFTDVEMVGETGFNSSPVTKGVLLRARKPAAEEAGRKEVSSSDSLGKYDEFFNAAYSEGAIDRKTKHLIALAASLAAGCDS